MRPQNPIPIFALFGETDNFPDVLHCESFSARAPIHAWHIQAHRHSNIAQLFVIRSGAVKAIVDGETSTLKSKEFLYIPAQKVHQFDFEPETEGQVFSLPTNIVSAIGPATPGIQTALEEPIIAPLEASLDPLLTALEKTTKTTGPFRAQRTVGLAHSVLAQIAEIGQAQHAKKKAQTSDRMSKLNALLTQHMADGWLAKDYAQALSLTTGHLSRICRQASGLGASAYIDQAVMTEASRLLAFTQLPVSEVGYRLGFADPSHFSKRFRRQRDQTPTDYRASFRG